MKYVPFGVFRRAALALALTTAHGLAAARVGSVARGLA